MTQYIDKSALVAEIWKRRNKHFNFGGSPSSEYCHEDDEILGIINTLEVKEVDLNEEIESYFKGFGKFPSVGIDDYIDIAKHFFELSLKTQKGKD